MDAVFERKTTEEVQAILDAHLSGDTDSPEITRGNVTDQASEASTVDSAFNELLG